MEAKVLKNKLAIGPMTAQVRRAFPFIVAVLLFGAGVLARPMLGRIKVKASSFVIRVFDIHQTHDDLPYDQIYYERKSSQYALLAKTQNIVFLGDSRVEQAEWSELFARQDISNRGINGDTTVGVLQRLRTSVPGDISLCVIQLGVNDLGEGCSVEFVVSRYGDILSDLMTRVHAKVIVTPVILVGQNRTNLNPAIIECNLKLERLAANHGALWVDINRPLCPDSILSASYSNDGVHLNGEGYKQVCNLLAPYLNRAKSN
jgi:lysophospholipase L1-like esterase